MFWEFVSAHWLLFSAVGVLAVMGVVHPPTSASNSRATGRLKTRRSTGNGMRLIIQRCPKPRCQQRQSFVVSLYPVETCNRPGICHLTCHDSCIFIQ